MRKLKLTTLSVIVLSEQETDRTLSDYRYTSTCFGDVDDLELMKSQVLQNINSAKKAVERLEA